jgi:hypothetical protein
MERFRRIAETVRDTEDGDGFARVLDRYVAGAAEGVRLDEAFGLAVQPGGTRWWAERRRSARDAAIRALAATFPGTAPAPSPPPRRCAGTPAPAGGSTAPAAVPWAATRAGGCCSRCSRPTRGRRRPGGRSSSWPRPHTWEEDGRPEARVLSYRLQGEQELADLPVTGGEDPLAALADFELGAFAPGRKERVGAESGDGAGRGTGPVCTGTPCWRCSPSASSSTSGSRSGGKAPPPARWDHRRGRACPRSGDG